MSLESIFYFLGFLSTGAIVITGSLLIVLSFISLIIYGAKWRIKKDLDAIMSYKFASAFFTKYDKELRKFRKEWNKK